MLFKVDFLFPTGSYKDRGAVVMMSLLSELGVDHVVDDDSSGNAGASVAAYAGAAGIDCTIYVPATNAPGKLAQIRAYGAEVVEVQGDRAHAARAAQAEAQDLFYASHNWHPAFHAGITTMGYEIWEQLDKTQPDAVIAPAGNGSIILGVHKAFEILREAECIDQLPYLFAVQSEAYPSLAEALSKDVEDPEPRSLGDTIAEGIATKAPTKGRHVLSAIRSSHGAAITVSDHEIRDALLRLARGGYYVEPTAAVGGAGHMKLLREGLLTRDAITVVVLTGTGLKTGVAAAMQSYASEGYAKFGLPPV